MGSADLRSLFKEAWQSLRRKTATQSTPARAVSRRAIFEEIEARLLFSADIAPGLIDPAAPSDPTQAAQTASVDPGSSTDSGSGTTTTVPDASQVASQMLTMPMAFEQNQGQVADSQIDYVARGNGYTTYLSDGNAQIDLQQGSSVQSLQLNLVGAQTPTAATGEDLLQSTTNYLNDPDKQLVNVANYGAVTYSNVYNGVDLSYYGNQQQLEYDFTVNPGANVNDIRLQFNGAKSVSVFRQQRRPRPDPRRRRRYRQLQGTGDLPEHCGRPSGRDEQLRHQCRWHGRFQGRRLRQEPGADHRPDVELRRLSRRYGNGQHHRRNDRQLRQRICQQA